MDIELIEAYKELIKYKYGAESFYLISYLYCVPSCSTKITKKLCGEILGSKTKGNKCYDIIMKIGAFPVSSNHEITLSLTPDISKLAEETEDNSKIKEFASILYKTMGGDYRQILSYSKSSCHTTISKEAERLGYSLEEYLVAMKTLINGDSFWSKVITGQTFLRKFDVLSKKFTPAKNVKNFNDIGHIF